MNKELIALEDIILYLNAKEPEGLYCKNVKIIKAGLKRLEERERQLLKLSDKLTKYSMENYELKKVLKIIKEKRVDVDYLLFSLEDFDKPLSHYNHLNEPLTETEFNLLKEVLL